MPPRPLAFADNNILIKALEKKEQPTLERLQDLLTSHRLVMAAESLVELSLSMDTANTIALGEAILSYQPLWLRSWLDIQRDEVRCFVQGSLLGRPAQPVVAVVDSFDQIFPDAARKIGSMEFLRSACQQAHRQAHDAQHRAHAQALQALQDSRRLKEFDRAMDERATLLMLQSRLPLTELARAGVSVHEALAHCLRHRDKLLASCPCLHTEWQLSEHRWRDPTRLPRPSDSIDLRLAVAALPHVDRFVTQDGYLREGLKYVKSKVPGIGATIDSLK